MKKVLTIIISLMLLCSMVGICAAATSTGESSQDTAVSYTLGSKYSIILPTSIDVGTKQYITVENQLLNTSEYLCFKTNGGLHNSVQGSTDRHMFLIGGDDEQVEDHIAYNITADVAPLNDLSSPATDDEANQEIVIGKWYVLASANDDTLINSRVSKSILITANILENQNPHHAGKYTDTVTITCDIMTRAEIEAENGVV